MKNLLMFACLGLFSLSSYSQEKAITFGSKKILPARSFKAITTNIFRLQDIKTSDGRKIDANTKTKTISGKEITVGEYLKKINNVEAKLNAKGSSLRSFSLANNVDMRKVSINQASKINAANKINAPENAKLLTFPQLSAEIKYHAFKKQPSLSGLPKIGVSDKLKGILRQLTAKTIEQKQDVTPILKSFTDQIANSQNASQYKAKLNFGTSQVKITSVFIPPADNSFNLGTTDSKFTVNTSFNADLIVDLYGIPVEVNLMDLQGEFEANAKNGVKNKRRVIVNYVGRSIINKTDIVNTDEFNEEFQNSLNISELSNFPTDINDFIPFNQFITFNVSFSNLGSIGAQYDVDMSKTHVDATVGPTYAMDLRVAASFGLDDVLEGGIEGIITLARGSLGFGGNAGIDLEANNSCKLINKMKITAGLSVLQGEVNLFTRYPDPLNWSCNFGPLPAMCIKKDIYPLYKTPVAFRVNRTLVENDMSVKLN